MKSLFLINLSSLFAITVLILYKVKDIFHLDWTMQTFLISIFAIVFALLVIIFFTNLLFNLILNRLTSFKLDFEENQGKVLNTILLVNIILFFILYILLYFNKSIIIQLQEWKYFTPIIFSILFSLLLKLNFRDTFRFNLGVITVNIIILLSQKLVALLV